MLLKWEGDPQYGKVCPSMGGCAPVWDNVPQCEKVSPLREGVPQCGKMCPSGEAVPQCGKVCSSVGM